MTSLSTILKKWNGSNLADDAVKYVVVTWKYSCLDINLTDVCSGCSNWPFFNIAPGKSLASNRRQAITWNNDGTIQRRTYASPRPSVSDVQYTEVFEWLLLYHQSHSRYHHYNDAIIGTLVSQIISLTFVYTNVYSCAEQRKHVRGIHWSPVNSPHKGPVTRKMFPFDDVIMIFE